MSRGFDPTKWIAKTQGEAGAVLGISSRTLREWIEKGCQCETSAGYSIPHALEWAKANVWASKSPAKPVGEGLDDMEAAELRCKVADAAIKEAKAEQLLGTLVDRETMQGAIASLLNSIRHRLQAAPEEVATAIPPEYRADVTLDLTDKIALILTEMAAWADSQQIDTDSGEIYGTEPETRDLFDDPASPSDQSGGQG